MLTEAMLTLTSYTATECKYGLLSQVTSPINAVCGKPVRVSPSYPSHSDKHLHRGLYTVFFQREICHGKRHRSGVSPEEHPCLTPRHGRAPTPPRSCSAWTEAGRRGQHIQAGNSPGAWDKGVAAP